MKKNDKSSAPLSDWEKPKVRGLSSYPDSGKVVRGEERGMNAMVAPTALTFQSLFVTDISEGFNYFLVFFHLSVSSKSHQVQELRFFGFARRLAGSGSSLHLH